MTNTPFTNTPVGNKQFVIEWELSANGNEAQGEAFEAIDCDLISLSSYADVTSGTAEPKLYASNLSALPASPGVMQALALNISGDYHIQAPVETMPFPVPTTTRWIFPRLEANSGVATLKFALLFRELA